MAVLQVQPTPQGHRTTQSLEERPHVRVPDVTLLILERFARLISWSRLPLLRAVRAHLRYGFRSSG